MYVCVCMCVCTCVCVFVHVSVYVCICACVPVCFTLHVYVYVCVYVCFSIYKYMSVCVYLCVCMCEYVCVCMGNLLYLRTPFIDEELMFIHLLLGEVLRRDQLQTTKHMHMKQVGQNTEGKTSIYYIVLYLCLCLYYKTKIK